MRQVVAQEDSSPKEQQSWAQWCLFAYTQGCRRGKQGWEFETKVSLGYLTRDTVSKTNK